LELGTWNLERPLPEIRVARREWVRYDFRMTILFTDPIFLKHDTGSYHPERIERLHSITARLEQAGLVARCRSGTVSPISEDEIGRVHSPAVLERAQLAVAEGGGYLDADTVVCPDSLNAAKCAAGAACNAVDAVLADDDRNAFCLIRPPGHHATRNRSMGFCIFSTIALAAQHALDRHQLSRILIVDWDVHHGNGTQDVFYAEPRVQFLSVHRYGQGFYPGSGAASETGTGPGLGHTANVPLSFGIKRAEYLDSFTSALEKCADKIRPELVLISAGFDAHRLDPIGSLGLESDDFEPLTQRVLEVANVHAKGRVVSCLEGGYNLKALAESAQIHLETFLSATP